MHPSALPSVPSDSSVVNPSASASSANLRGLRVPPSPSASADDPDPRTLTRREEAFTLYCHGYRSPAIASLLGVPQRTVRSWIADTLKASADESRTRRDQQLLLAIESQRAIVQAAWHAYDRAARAERLTLEHLQNAVPFNVDDDESFADPDPYAPPSPPQRRGGQGVRTLPRLPTAGARYLQIVLHAQREIARLSGLYDLPDSFFDPNAGRPMQIVIRREPHLPRHQLTAWAAFREQWNAAHPHDPIPPEDLVFPPEGAPHHDFTPDEDDDPDDPDDLDGSASSSYGGYSGATPASYEDHHATAGDPDAPPDDSSAGNGFHSSIPLAQSDLAAETAMRSSLQPVQAGFVAERPVGADSSAGPPESAAETATPAPASTDPVAIASAEHGPPPAPTADIPTAIHPSLLPRFRRRGSHPMRPPLIRQGFGTP